MAFKVENIRNKENVRAYFCTFKECKLLTNNSKQVINTKAYTNLRNDDLKRCMWWQRLGKNKQKPLGKHIQNKEMF